MPVLIRILSFVRPYKRRAALAQPRILILDEATATDRQTRPASRHPQRRIEKPR